jgi:hypothetical protein
MLGYATTVISRLKDGLGLVPSIFKLKSSAKKVGVVGIALNIVFAALQTVETGNLNIVVNELGYSFFLLDKGIGEHVDTLLAAQGALSFGEFAVLSLGIYSKLWFILFITEKFAAFREKSAVGDNAPKYTLFLETLIFVITPLQFAGAMTFNLLTTGQVTSLPSVWGGTLSLVFNLDVWASQLQLNIVKLPFVSTDLIGSVGNESSRLVNEQLSELGNNSTVNNSNVSDDGVAVIGGGSGD